MGTKEKEHTHKRKHRVVRRPAQSAFQRSCRLVISMLLFAVLILTTLAFGGMTTWCEIAVACLVLMACGIWLVLIMTEEKVSMVTTPILAPVLIFAAYVVVRYALTNVESLARQQMMTALSGGLIFLLALQHLSHRERVLWAGWVFVTMGFVVAMWGVLGWVFNSETIWGQTQPLVYRGRASGPFVRPGHFGSYLTICFSVSTSFFFFSRLSIPLKTSLAVASTLMAFAVLLSSSMAALVALLTAAGVIMTCLVRNQAYRYRWLAVGSCLLIVVLAGTLLMLRTQELSGADPPRLMLWKTAWMIAKDSPIIGHGPGMFAWYFPTQRVLQGSVSAVGNEFLNVLVDYGVVGLILILWMIVAFFFSSVTILRARLKLYAIRTRSNRLAMVVAGLAAVAALSVQAMVDFNLQAPANLFALLILAAITTASGLTVEGSKRRMREKSGAQNSESVKGIVRVALMAGLAAALLLLGSRVRLALPSAYYLWRASQAQAQLDWQNAHGLYQAAWRHDRDSYSIAAQAGDFCMARATWSRESSREKWQKEALRWYERAYICNPFAADILIKTARLFDAQGNRNQARDRYQKALKFDPHNGAYHAQIGLHHQRWGDTEAAVASFVRAYELGGAGDLPRQQLTILGLL